MHFRIPIAIVSTLCLGACAALNSGGGSAPEAKPPAPALEPFTQPLSGTTLAIDMMPVPGGTITYDVDGETITEEIAPFWFAKTETIWQLYDVFVFLTDEPDEATGPEAIARPSRPYVAPDRGYGHDDYAGISISFHSAQQFCTWLSAKSGRTFRLPTEAEWRHACSLSGVTPDNVLDYAWCDDNADWTPHPVATKPADALGLHDLWGNVREWATTLDGDPIAMGGCFFDPKDELGCGLRNVPTRDWQMTDPQVPKSIWWLSDADFMGIRVVCVPR